MHDFKVIKVGKQSGRKSGEKNSHEYDGACIIYVHPLVFRSDGCSFH